MRNIFQMSGRKTNSNGHMRSVCWCFCQISIILILISGGCTTLVDRSSLQFRNGLYYIDDSVTPFTGKAVTKKNGRIVAEYSYLYGKQHGTCRGWHDNGQMSYKYNYQDGKTDGKLRRWHDNGKKESEKEFRNGVAHGKFIRWHYNGQINLDAEFRNDKQHGIWRGWRKNGQKFIEEEYRDGICIRSQKYDEGMTDAKELINESTRK